jgi:hypothetical protein
MAEATTGEEKMAPKRAHEEEEQETEPSKKVMKLPQKKYYRQRAHANPLSFQNLFHPKDPDRQVT